MVNLELVALKVKCDRQYQTIVKLQDEKIDLFKENQQLKEVIEEIRKIVKVEKEKMGYAVYDSCLLFIEEALNKVDKER